MSDGYTNTISGLQRKRDEIGQELDRLKAETARLRNDMQAIERTLSAFGVHQHALTPAHYDSIFERGEVTRVVLRHLREHGSATTRDIATAACIAKGYDPDDRYECIRVQEKIARRLAQFESKKLAMRFRDNGRWVWKLL